MSVLAVIPARGGSKRVPRKNLRNLGGRALVAWSIQAALESELVDRVVVHTDDDEIARVAQGWGAEVVMRPEHLAASIHCDSCRIEAALLHAMRKRGDDPTPPPDLIVTLQPTSPIRRPGLIDECIRRLMERPEANSVLTAAEVGVTWWLEEDMLSPRRAWVNQFGARTIPQRQDWMGTDDRLAEDGSVFVTRYKPLVEQNDRRARPVSIVVNDRTVDIDTEADFALAEALLSVRMEGQKIA